MVSHRVDEEAGQGCLHTGDGSLHAKVWDSLSVLRKSVSGDRWAAVKG